MSNPSLDAGDVEKALPSEGRADGRHHGIPDGLDDRRTDPTATLAADKVEGRIRSFERQLIRLHIEARGIERVEPHERHALTWRGYVSVFCLWFSVNLAAVNITLGMLASQIFELSFKDASLCAVLGSMTGSMATAYIATFGPVSGNRSMVQSSVLACQYCISKIKADIRKVYHGLVAEQASGALEHYCSPGVFYDWVCDYRPDTIGCI